MKKILLMTLALSTLMWADFTRSGEIVTDSRTLLQWQDDDTFTDTTWTEAITYCENLSLGGQSDWRLPNINELLSIVDHSKYKPSISTVFRNNVSGNHWSSTTDFGNSRKKALIVNLNKGNQLRTYKVWDAYVRCVRTVQ